MPYIIAVIVAVVLGVGFTLLQSNKAAAPTSEPTPVAKVEEVPVAEASFKDGTYKADTSYKTPKMSTYNMNVSLTVANGVVTDAAVLYSDGAEKDPNAQRFEAAYKTEVIGKELKSINLSRVGGASLTTNAFNNALVEIKKQAQS